jgi:Ca-activated chloride channel family protein
MIDRIFYFLLLLFLISSCSDTIGDDQALVDPTRDGFIGISALDNSTGGGGVIAGIGGETYDTLIENPFIAVEEEPISTFSIDADGGAYSNVRDLIEMGAEIPRGAVRTEELINYFQYDYQDNGDLHPISVEGEVCESPWQSGNKMIRIGIKGRDIARADLPGSNLVFLIDRSGSMQHESKLPLLKEGLKLLVNHLREDDRVAIVTYASQPGVHLESTSVRQRDLILASIDALGAGGSTNGEGGILTAYDIAQAHFIEGGNNRIILGSDGDFNVGISDKDKLVELIEQKRDEGIFLTTLGLGRGNYRDNVMEQLANNGNGTYEYLDNLDQCRKVFVEEYNKFFTVAKDVKVQLEFNPDLVEQYRLIGYENRLLETEDFDDDTKDAGEIGAGQEITAIYEIIPTAIRNPNLPLFGIDFRYKEPNSETSVPISVQVYDEGTSFLAASESTRFAAAVASFGMFLNQSDYIHDMTLEEIELLVQLSKTYNPNAYKDGFQDLLRKLR